MTLSGCMLLWTLLMLQFTSAEHKQCFKSDYLISCDSQQDSNCEDQTLDQVADDVTESSPALECASVYINTSHLELTTNASFSGLRSFTISGSVDLNATITCSLEDYGGLEFINITNLTITSLTVTNCGFKSQSSTGHRLYLYSYRSAVTILCCKYVKVNHLVVRNNNGIGLKILNHQGGTVHIESSLFLENRLLNKSCLNEGGGGVYIGGFEHPSEPITFQFDNCIFQKNEAHTQCYDFLYTDDFGRPITGYGLGGGAAILFRNDLSNIHATFSECKFIKNLAFKGGGLAAEIEATKDMDSVETSNVTVRVENCLFEGNGCNSSGGNMTASGGGMSINFKSKEKSTFHSNKFVICNVTFAGNCAIFGGGLYFYSDHEVHVAMNETSPNTVKIENCTFKSNKAHTGSAVDITPNVFQRLAMIKSFITPVFKNCLFISNSVQVNYWAKNRHHQVTYGIGTLYVSLYNVKFEGYNCFKNNIGTAIHIVNGNIDMSRSSATFYKNRGIQGGAIALIGQSSIIVGPNKTYNFENNTAYVNGGGLYVQLDDNHDITASKSCFIQYIDADGHTTTPARDWTAAIEFRQNRAIAGALT